MDLESVSLKLPRELLSDAQQVATARDVSVGHLVRQLLSREVERQFKGLQDGRADALLLTALSALLSHDLVEADSWENLGSRLRPHGYAMQRSGSGLALVKISCGTRVCSGSELGVEYDLFCKRFGGPMPTMQESKTHLGMMPGGKIDNQRQKMLCGHIDAARNWPDLINRLAAEGMELRAIGAGVGIYITSTGRHLCNLSSVGARYVTLVKRYGAALPNHPYDMSEHLNPTSDSDV